MACCDVVLRGGGRKVGLCGMRVRRTTQGERTSVRRDAECWRHVIAEGVPEMAERGSSRDGLVRKLDFVIIWRQPPRCGWCAED